MKNTSKMIIIIAAVIILLLLIFEREDSLKPIPPTAVNGVIDLTAWDFEKEGNVKLDGTWEFYWNQLVEPLELSPETKEKPLKPTGFIKVPGSWEGVLDNTPIGKKGVGSYRLTIKVNPEYTMYGIKTTNIRMSHSLYVNGRLVGNSGTPGSSEDEDVVDNVPYTAIFPSEDNTIEVIIPVSDYDYLSGGIVQPIYIGLEKAISNYNMKLIALDLIAVSALAMTSLYFICVFVFRRKDLSLLYFSAYCILFAFFLFTYNEKVFMQVFPHIDYILILKIKMPLLFLCFTSVMLFLNAIGEQFLPKKIMTFYIAVYVIFIIFMITTPLSIYSQFEVHMLAFTMTANLLIAYQFIKASIKKEYGNIGKQGVRLLCLASLFVVVNYAGTFLYNASVLHTFSIPIISLVLFILSITLFVSKKYSDAFLAAESMSQSLIQMDKMKDEFLINTSHELRTPLHGIINITQAILDKTKEISPKQADDLNYIVSIATRLSSLINDIIDFQSMKSKNIHLQIKTIDLNAPVQNVIDVLERMYQSKGIIIRNTIPPGTYYVRSDENRLRQILFNLAGNAMKYTNHGEVVFEAEVRDFFVTVVVSDTGMGIAQDLQSRIFKYYEHTEETFEAESSNGLGLPIARQLTRALGGDLWLEESLAGKGTKFSFTQPLATAEEITDRQIAAITEDKVHDREITERLHFKSIKSTMDFTILAVDDEISNIKVIQEIFTNEKCKIIAAYHGTQALEIIKDNRNISMVLLDVMMPGMSGFEVCRKIRKDYTLFDLPVLLLTVRNTAEDIAAGLDAGANDFLVKPFDAKELKARVQTLLELKKSVRNSISAKTAFLHSQIKPHFIYNALSVIISLCYIDGERAGELLAEFSNYLRCSFDFDPYSSFVSLQKELSMVNSYVEIEKARFGDRLKVFYDVAEELYESSIPALILQPLVENAIRHGLMKRTKGGEVWVKAWREGEIIFLTIKDNGVGMALDKVSELLDIKTEKKGVGVRNIHQRLLNLYGQGLTIESSEEEGTLVKLAIPYLKTISMEGLDE